MTTPITCPKCGGETEYEGMDTDDNETALVDIYTCVDCGYTIQMGEWDYDEDAPVILDDYGLGWSVEDE